MDRRALHLHGASRLIYGPSSQPSNRHAAAAAAAASAARRDEMQWNTSAEAMADRSNLWASLIQPISVSSQSRS